MEGWVVAGQHVLQTSLMLGQPVQPSLYILQDTSSVQSFRWGRNVPVDKSPELPTHLGRRIRLDTAGAESCWRDSAVSPDNPSAGSCQRGRIARRGTGSEPHFSVGRRNLPDTALVLRPAQTRAPRLEEGGCGGSWPLEPLEVLPLFNL